MPVIINNDEKPTYVAKPDMRFATTFLSYKFRDYAVNGESLQDKWTGELYTKREDGRTVSFFQNKKIYEDLCLNLRIALNNNPEFAWPKEDPKAYFMVTNYDSLQMFSEKRLDILTTDVVFPNDDDNVSTQFKFNLSKGTNGFFIGPISRDPDKPAIEFLTAKYNEFFENYDGPNADYALEKAKFESNTKWKYSNATIHYTVKITKGEESQTYTVEDWIRCNEMCSVLLPYTRILRDFPDGYDKALVTIRGIEFYKIHFMVDHLSEFGEDFIALYNKYVCADHEMYMDWFEVYSFIDDAEDMLFHGNEFLVAMLDVPYFKQYLIKMGSILSAGGIIMSTERPDEGLWVANVVWGERVYDVYRGGTKVNREMETNILKTGARFAGIDYKAGVISRDLTDFDDFCLMDLNTSTYTEEEVNAMVNRIVTSAKDKTKKVIVRSPDNDNLGIALEEVTDEGLVLGTVETSEVEDESEGPNDD